MKKWLKLKRLIPLFVFIFGAVPGGFYLLGLFFLDQVEEGFYEDGDAVSTATLAHTMFNIARYFPGWTSFADDQRSDVFFYLGKGVVVYGFDHVPNIETIREIAAFSEDRIDQANAHDRRSLEDTLYRYGFQDTIIEAVERFGWSEQPEIALRSYLLFGQLEQLAVGLDHLGD